MKTKTPMYTLSQHFKNFDINISEFIDTRAMNKVELSKSSEKFSPFGNTNKGVSSDFIRIYQDKTEVVGKKTSNNYSFYYERKEYNSFAFVFSYMEVEEPYITVTIKTDGNNYISSEPYSVDQMKALMKAFNKKISEIKMKSPLDIFTVVQEIFIGDNGVDEETIVNDAVSFIDATFKELNEDIEAQSRKYKSAKVMYTNSYSEYVEKLEHSEEYQKLQELKKELRKAETALSKKDRKLKLDYKIKPKKTTLKRESTVLNQLENKKETKLTKMIKQYPFHLRNSILENIK